MEIKFKYVVRVMRGNRIRTKENYEVREDAVKRYKELYIEFAERYFNDFGNFTIEKTEYYIKFKHGNNYDAIVFDIKVINKKEMLEFLETKSDFHK